MLYLMHFQTFKSKTKKNYFLMHFIEFFLISILLSKFLNFLFHITTNLNLLPHQAV
jgi:hypothetical protein